MENNIKFTAIIPTRERADTLFFCLRTIVEQEYENLTIIVSDNCSQDNTREVVNSFKDPRIKYINTGKRVSMSHNWEFALNHVSGGGWVTIVGDDDGLLPGAFDKVANIIKATKSQAVRTKLCSYRWPNSYFEKNLLIVPLSLGFESRNSHEWLGKLLNGNAGYIDLPMLYTGGFVDMDVVNQARDNNGKFYRSMIPDIYSAVALASVLESYVMLNEPVAVEGTSSHSTGASQASGADNAKPIKTFCSESNIPFHATLNGDEFIKSISIIIYESYLQSINLHKNFLEIKLEDQLGMALAKIGHPEYDNLRSYCSQVADRNGVSMTVVEQKKNEYNKLKKRNSSDATNFEQLLFSGKELGIRNVYDAAIVAKALYIFENNNMACDNILFENAKIVFDPKLSNVIKYARKNTLKSLKYAIERVHSHILHSLKCILPDATVKFLNRCFHRKSLSANK